MVNHCSRLKYGVVDVSTIFSEDQFNFVFCSVEILKDMSSMVQPHS